MKQLYVDLGKNSYPIVIDNSFERLSEFIEGKGTKCVIVTDVKVSQYHLISFQASIEAVFQSVYTFVVSEGEKSKSMDTLKELYTFLIQHDICRNDVIAALGGGVIGDLAGYAAATYSRGIGFIQVPTTLLAQVDSSVGGKTGINYMNYKNFIGSFYQPGLCYININVLKTLPKEEIRNGLAETVVHAIIKDEALFTYLEINLERIVKMELDLMEELVYRNVKIKRDIVQNDEKDKGERAILNFGHTFGHGIESAYKYQYKHGECVAVGILGACYLAEKFDFIESSVTRRIENLLNRMNVLISISNCDVDSVLNFILHDKKTTGKNIHFILPRNIGVAFQYEINDLQLIRETLRKLMERKAL